MDDKIDRDDLEQGSDGSGLDPEEEGANPQIGGKSDLFSAEPVNATGQPLGVVITVVVLSAVAVLLLALIAWCWFDPQDTCGLFSAGKNLTSSDVNPIELSREAPPSYQAGTLTVNQQQIGLDTMLARSSMVTGRATQLPELSARPALRRIELLFFAENLTAEQRQDFELARDPLLQSGALIGTEPLLLLTIYLPGEHEVCASQYLLGLELKVNPQHPASQGLSSADLADFNIPVTALGRRLSFTCDFSRPEAPFILSFDGSRLSQEAAAERLDWSLRSSSPLSRFRAVGRLNYVEPSDTVALWQPQSGQLQIAFYWEELSASDLEHIRSSRGFSLPGGPQPKAVARLPLEPELSELRHEFVKNGYQVKLYPLVTAPSKFPPDRDRLVQEYPPGVFPNRLSGPLKEDSRLIGRFQDRILLPLERGYWEINFSLPFNAPLLVVE